MERLGTSRSGGGFTLIELALVMALLGTIGALVTPVFRRFWEGLTADTATDEFRGALTRARDAAIRARRPVRVDLDPTTGRWSTWIWRADARAFDPLKERWGQGALPGGMAYEATTTSLGFYPDGSADDFEVTVRTAHGENVGKLAVSALTGTPGWDTRAK